jgi:hypothetical protein
MIYSRCSSLDHDENPVTTADYARDKTLKLNFEYEVHRNVHKSFGERSTSRINTLTQLPNETIKSNRLTVSPKQVVW